MANAATASIESTETQVQVFPGPRKNLVAAVSLLVAGGLAFSMGLTGFFFTEATAWVVLSYGAFLLYSNLLEMNESYIVDDENLTLHSPFRFWGISRSWAWEYIKRLEVQVGRNDPNMEDVKLNIFYEPKVEGDPGAMYRASAAYHPELARIIVEKTGLSGEIEDIGNLPEDGPAIYSWS